MRRVTAAVGSAVFFVVAPGTIVGLIPWLLTGWQLREPVPPIWAPMRVLGAILLVAGLIVLVQAFVRFVVEGLGTPAPIAAPERLVVGGCIAMCATLCMWPYWRPSPVRRCSWASSVCCCTPQPSG